MLPIYSRKIANFFLKQHHKFILKVTNLFSMLQINSQNIRNLFSKCYKVIIEMLQINSRKIKNAFSKCCEFILEMLQIWSQEVTNLSLKC